MSKPVFSPIESIAKRITKNDRDRLEKIFAPTVVTVPIENARRNIAVMPDGEIRSYGLVQKTAAADEGMGGIPAYISSANGGLDWHLVPIRAKRFMGPAARNPVTGRYVTVVNRSVDGERGAFVRYTDIDLDDENFVEKKIAEIDGGIMQTFHPLFIKKRNRWIVPTNTVKGTQHPMVLYSDDDGESWNEVHLNPIPIYEKQYPHKGVRWQNTGVEPIITERSDGSLYLLARGSHDFFYEYISQDGGERWTEGAPSLFHGTLTTPFFLPLSDGRQLLFFNNTRPMAEVDQSDFIEPYRVGRAEDYFTNRDANHVAISDGGFNWQGFRELFLNQIRNAPDFRLKGGIVCCNDKSVHQFQAIELPYGKVLVEFGQHEIARKTVIFDINWLYEKQRNENLQLGLAALSTQMYVKSIPGHSEPPYGGHCAYNRTDGALLVEDPAKTGGEALQICNVEDPRLVSNKQGAVWNFPAAHMGRLLIEIRRGASGLRISLADHWINPSDPYVADYAAFSLPLDDSLLEKDTWHELIISFDTKKGKAEILIDGEPKKKFNFSTAVPFGLSYLHMQTLAETRDYEGSYVRFINFKAN